MLKSLDRLSCWIRGVSYPEPEVRTGIDWLWEQIFKEGAALFVEHFGSLWE